MDKKELIEQGIDGIDLKYIEKAVEPKERKLQPLKLRWVKKGWIRAAAALLLCVLAGGVLTGILLTHRAPKGYASSIDINAGQTTPAETDKLFAETKSAVYHSLEELENAADLILIGKKTADVPSICSSQGKALGTVSNFRIDSVIKDVTGSLEAGSVIKVLEQTYRSGGNIYRVAGCTEMNTEDRYILHLRIVNQSAGISTPLGVNYGVASLGTEYRTTAFTAENNTADSFAQIDRIRAEAREKHMN